MQNDFNVYDAILVLIGGVTLTSYIVSYLWVKDAWGKTHKQIVDIDTRLKKMEEKK